MFGKLYKDEDGLTTVEYALLLALLVVAAIGVWSAFGTRIQGSITASTAALDTAESAGSTP